MSAAPTFRESAATAEAAQAGLLYERYARRILGYCRNRLASQEEVEDAVQHTFLNAYRSLSSGTVPRAEAAWLFKIAENVCRERRRSAWRRSRIEIVSDDGLVGDEAAPERSHDELTGIADALAELTPNQRRAILMREWQGLSYREIATELALTEAAVETLLFRARRSLARKLDRSRGRVWGWANVGSALTGAKALLGGTAAQVVAATAVLATGVTAATPAVRHEATHHTAVPVHVAPSATSHAAPRITPSASREVGTRTVPAKARSARPVARPPVTHATPAPPTAAPPASAGPAPQAPPASVPAPPAPTPPAVQLPPASPPPVAPPPPVVPPPPVAPPPLPPTPPLPPLEPPELPTLPPAPGLPLP